MDAKNSNAVVCDDLLALAKEWKRVAGLHRLEQSAKEAGGDFERGRRQQLMAEIYDICRMEIELILRRTETQTTHRRNTQ